MALFSDVLLTVDYDRTLTGPDSVVPERNWEAIRYFIDNGMRDTKAAEEDSVLDILDREYSKAIFHTASIGELIERVKEHNFVPVTDDRGCFIGIVLRRDVLGYLLEFYNGKQ